MSMRIDPRAILRPGTLRKQADTPRELKKTGDDIAWGHRIDQAADETADLAAALPWSKEMRALDQGWRRLQDGSLLLQTAEGGLDAMSGHLHRMRELALGASNDLLREDQRRLPQQEFDGLKVEIDHTSTDTRYAGMPLLDGSSSQEEFSARQAGSQETATITVDLSRNLDAQSLGLGDSRIDGSDSRNARLALEDIDNALGSIGNLRAEFGAADNRLMDLQRGLAITAENTFAAGSGPMDADFAVETSYLVSQQVMDQSARAVLAQSRGISVLTLGLLR